MKYSLFAAAVLSLGAVAMVSRPTGEGLEVGKPAPNVTASTWFNHIGTDIDLASLKGQAVVLEFWATW